MAHNRFSSCSYRVHESCPYRVFSLQEFKQSDSRASSSSNYCTNFREKQVKEKETKKRVCMKPQLQRRKSSGIYETLLAELRLEDKYYYNILFQLIKADITKHNAKMKELIPPRL